MCKEAKDMLKDMCHNVSLYLFRIFWETARKKTKVIRFRFRSFLGAISRATIKSTLLEHEDHREFRDIFSFPLPRRVIVYVGEEDEGNPLKSQLGRLAAKKGGMWRQSNWRRGEKKSFEANHPAPTRKKGG